MDTKTIADYFKVFTKETEKFIEKNLEIISLEDFCRIYQNTLNILREVASDEHFSGFTELLIFLYFKIFIKNRIGKDFKPIWIKNKKARGQEQRLKGKFLSCDKKYILCLNRHYSISNQQHTVTYKWGDGSKDIARCIPDIVFSRVDNIKNANLEYTKGNKFLLKEKSEKSLYENEEVLLAVEIKTYPAYGLSSVKEPIVRFKKIRDDKSETCRCFKNAKYLFIAFAHFKETSEIFRHLQESKKDFEKWFDYLTLVDEHDKVKQSESEQRGTTIYSTLNALNIL
jgi:hypothetical protein